MALTELALASRPVRRLRRHRRAAIAILAVLVLATGAVVGGIRYDRWKHGLHVFAPPASLAGSPVAVGRTYYALTGASAERVVDVRSVTPIVDEHATTATVRIAVCRHTGAALPLVGATRRLTYCDTMRPFTPGPLSLTDFRAGDALVYAVTAHRAGVIDLSGVRIHYRIGDRDGTDISGVPLELRAG